MARLGPGRPSGRAEPDDATPATTGCPAEAQECPTGRRAPFRHRRASSGPWRRAAAYAACVAALALRAGAAAAEPAFVFVGPDWRMEIGPAEVFGFQSVAAAGGRIALSVTLRPEAAARLERLTGASLANRLTVEDGDGGALLAATLAEPIRGRFAVAFADAEAARRAARRMQGQP